MISDTNLKFPSSKFRDEGKVARVEIVPLIDVMFLLVAFFIVVSASLVEERGISVQLGMAATEDNASLDPNTIVVSVIKDEVVFLDTTEVSVAELPSIIKAQCGSLLQCRVRLQADREVSHGKVISVLDHIRTSGVSTVEFGVQANDWLDK